VTTSQPAKLEWKWGLLSALFIALLATYPQLHLLVELGSSAQGAYAYFDTDEVAYSAYLQALIDGRPRRNDPFSCSDLAGKQLSESLFSVQFLTPYFLAVPARLFGLSATTVFILLMPLVGATTALALFWLLAQITNDNKLAAVGVIVVLCLATMASGQGLIRALAGFKPLWSYMPFLRRYTPAVGFPFFFLMFSMLWRAIRIPDRKYIWRALGTGLIISFLVYSYFYLWTAALAWLGCVAIVWLIVRPEGWQRCLWSVVIAGGVSILAIIPYLILLSNRAVNTDQVTILESTRSLDLIQPSELVAICVLIICGLLKWKRKLASDGTVLFAISLLILPFAVFNQQLISGFSMQPFHYEEFVTSYCVLIAILILLPALFRAMDWRISTRVLFWIGVISIAYGANSASAISRAALPDNITRDRTLGVARYLKSHSSSGLILPVDLVQAEALPTSLKQPVLWAVHSSVFPGVSVSELRERYYQYLFYSGISASDLRKLLEAKNHVAFVAVFGYEREVNNFGRAFVPVSDAEIQEQVSLYDNYVISMSKTVVAKYPLQWLIVPKDSNFSYSAIDRWYERSESKEVANFLVYRLRLR